MVDGRTNPAERRAMCVMDLVKKKNTARALPLVYHRIIQFVTPGCGRICVRTREAAATAGKAAETARVTRGTAATKALARRRTVSSCRGLPNPLGRRAPEASAGQGGRRRRRRLRRNRNARFVGGGFFLLHVILFCVFFFFFVPAVCGALFLELIFDFFCTRREHRYYILRSIRFCVIELRVIFITEEKFFLFFLFCRLFVDGEANSMKRPPPSSPSAAR